MRGTLLEEGQTGHDYENVDHSKMTKRVEKETEDREEDRDSTNG